MSHYRNALPQLNTSFITDGGLETTMVFHKNLNLPEFAAFTMLATEEGRKQLEEYFRSYIELARTYGAGIILESPTWRANADWGNKLGYSASDLNAANQNAIAQLVELRNQYAGQTGIVISGCIGPRGDGYRPENLMTPEQAETYHREQIQTFAETQADMVCAMTLNYVEEAIGIVRAAQKAHIPVAISFTVETNGLLPTGQSLREAIEQVDRETGSGAQYFMVNCAHPTHFLGQIEGQEGWLDRIYGVRANASKCSHAELDDAEELDIGNPIELGQNYQELLGVLRNLKVMGGCCGTDQRHIEHICQVCL